MSAVILDFVRLYGRYVLAVIVLTLHCSVPVHAGDLKVGVPGFPLNAGNPFPRLEQDNRIVHRALFDGLTQLDAGGNIVPALAISWRTEGPTAWHFELRRDVEFSNGEPFNAEAVQAVISWLKSSSAAGVSATNLVANIDRVETLDRYSVIIHTAIPDATLPSKMAGVVVVPSAAWAQLGPAAFVANPAGTGPFTLATTVVGAGQIVLAANPDSWRAPKVDSLTLVSMPNAAARAQALLVGESHVATGLDLAQIDTIQSGGALVTTSPAYAVSAIALRQDEGRASPLKDVRARQALNYGLDKNKLASEVFNGLTAPAGQPVGRWSHGYNPAVAPFPHNPERAKELLFEAGIVTPFSLRLDVVAGRFPGDAELYGEIAEQLKEIGVEVEVRTISQGQWLENFTSNTWPVATDGFSMVLDALPTNDIFSAFSEYACGRPAPLF